ncbi:MAG TPA: 50S ribosomal protein L15 [Dehalococcoidia bacterium]|nr:50S ribosomal protein L15 [Dehalococcoidia bacterium]
MLAHELRPPRGAKHRRKRVGRGDSSGHGSYSGRGIKGQKARAGKPVPPWFEGGQTRLVKGLPKMRGFVNPFKVQYEVVNVGQLNRFPAGSEVTPELLRQQRLVRDEKRPLKVLGGGELKVALTVHAHRFSQSAREKIEAAGGRALSLEAGEGDGSR